LKKKPFESTLSRFVTGTLAIGIGRFSTVALGFLGLAIATRWLSLEAMGAFTLLRVISSFSANLSDFGLETTLTKLISSNSDEQYQRKLINTAIYFRCVTIAAASVFSLLASELFFLLFGRFQYADLFIYMPALIATESIYRLLNPILLGKFKFAAVSLIEITSSVANFVLTVVFVVWLQLGVFGLIYMRIAFQVLAIIITYFAANIQHRFEFDFQKLKTILVFGFPLYLNSILSYIFSRADTFLIGGLLGPAEIALYEIARKIPESLEMLFEAFRQVYFPFISKLFAEDKLEKATRMIQTSLRLVTFTGMFGTIIAFIFGKEILILFFSDKYAASAPVFGILMVLLTFNVIDTMLGYSIVAVGDSDKPPKINIFRTAVNFFGYLMLIPVLRLLGAALASLIGTITVNPLNVFFLRKRKLDIQFRTFLKPMLIFCLILVLLFALNPQCIRPKLALLALYILICLMFSIVTQDDINLVVTEAKLLLARFFKKPPLQGSEIE